jgi:hypothetical protein
MTPAERNPMDIAEAFQIALRGSIRKPEPWYVCLMRTEQYYGGPEEGGWWGCDTFLEQWAEFPTEEAANRALDGIERLAKGMSEEEERDFNLSCLESCEWAEARGIEPCDLPEVGGATKYFVLITNALPEAARLGPRHYE